MTKDLLTRIAELAGTDIADKIASEFGGDQVYIRRSLVPKKMVRCSECAHIEHTKGVLPKCGLSHFIVGLYNPRICDQFAESAMHRISLNRLRILVRHHPTIAVLASTGGGLFAQRKHVLAATRSRP